MSQDRSKLRWNGWGWAARKDELAAREDVWAWLAGELGMPALLATPARALEELSVADSTLSLADRAALVVIVGESQVRDSLAERAFHSRGRSYRDLLHLLAGDLSEAPDAVVYPRGTNEVLAILALAAQRRIAVIPFGGGTALHRGAAGLRKECESVITLDLSDMDRIITVDTATMTAEVEAGIYASTLEAALKEKGLTFGQPTASADFSTLGGCIAAEAGGADWLISAKLAAPAGLLDTAQIVDGVDLTALLRGSEGQFGIITEVTIGLKPLPNERRLYTYHFSDFSTALTALRVIQQDDHGPAPLSLGDVEETKFFGRLESLGKTPKFWERRIARVRQWRGPAVEPCRMMACFEGANAGEQHRRFEAIARRHGAVRAACAASPLRDGGYLRDSLLERAVGLETFVVDARWVKLQNVYATTRAALEMVLRETAPREGAQGVVLCQVCEARAWGARLVFTAIFPRAVGADIAQSDKITAAAHLAMRASGGVPHRSAPPLDENAPAVTAAIRATLDPRGVLAPGQVRF